MLAISSSGWGPWIPSPGHLPALSRVALPGSLVWRAPLQVHSAADASVAAAAAPAGQGPCSCFILRTAHPWLLWLLHGPPCRRAFCKAVSRKRGPEDSPKRPSRAHVARVLTHISRK